MCLKSNSRWALMWQESQQSSYPSYKSYIFESIPILSYILARKGHSNDL